MEPNILQLIYEYQVLAGKEERLEIDLSPEERARRVTLKRILLGERPDEGRGRRRYARVASPMRAEFTQPGGFGAGEVRELSGGGLRLATPRPPAAGTRLVVRIASESDGLEYVFPCRVVWRSRTGPGCMGVAFDGVPTRGTLFGARRSAPWRRSMHLGERRSEPLVA